jgi:hypothetical protein
MKRNPYQFCEVTAHGACLNCRQLGANTHGLLNGASMLGHLCSHCLDRAWINPTQFAKQLRRTARKLTEAAEMIDSGGLRVDRSNPAPR